MSAYGSSSEAAVANTPKGDYKAAPEIVNTHNLNPDGNEQDQESKVRHSENLENGLGSSKILDWIPALVVVVFTAIILPIGIYGNTVMYGKTISDIYDFKLDEKSLLKTSYGIVTSDNYDGLYNIYPVLVSIQANDGKSLIDNTAGHHGLAFRLLSGKIQADWMMGKVLWLKQVTAMSGYFMDSYNDAMYVAGDGNEQSVIKFGWKTPVVTKANLDSIESYLHSTAFFQSGNFTFTVASPGLEEPGDVSVAVMIAFPFVYLILYFFAVAARTSLFSFVVPIVSVTVAVVVSFGCLAWVEASVKVTTFAIALSLSTALSFSGASTIAIVQRAAANSSFDDSFGRPIRQRVFLAFTDIKFFLVFPLITGTLFFLTSTVKDEAVRSISRSVGAACYVTFFVNVLLLPSAVILFYPYVFKEYVWWTTLMATLRLPLSVRRSTSEESEREQIMSAVRDVHSRNREKKEDTILSRAVVAARSKPWVAFGATTGLYVIMGIILLSTSLHQLTNYNEVVSPQSKYVRALRKASSTYGTSVAIPYFFIIQLAGPDNKTEVSESDFNLINSLTTDVLNEGGVLGNPQLDQLWSMASFESNFITYKDYINMVDTTNRTQIATQYRHLLNEVLSADLMYAAVKMYLPSKSNCYEETYAEFMMHVEHFAIKFGSLYPNTFVGAFGPSAGMWDAVNDVGGSFKIEVALLCVFIILVYLIVTRALGASLFGFVWCVLHVMAGMFFGAMTQNLTGFYYVSPPITLLFCVQLFIFNDLGSLEIQIALREQKRLSNDRIIVESLNQSEPYRWHTLVVSTTFFMLLFSLVDVVATVGVSVAVMLWMETFVFRLFVYPSFLLFLERSGNVKRFFFFRSVAENVGEISSNSQESNTLNRNNF